MSTLPKIIAVDFDGTLFENAWPDVGAPIEKNINKLKAELIAELFRRIPGVQED